MWPFARRGDAGGHGEGLAARHLRRQGYKILARNYRCPSGEADIIALAPDDHDGAGAIAFVEVKTRSASQLADPESAVDRRKRRQIVGVARYYLSCRDIGDRPVRFDTVAVILADGQKPVIRHTPDAFGPE